MPSFGNKSKERLSTCHPLIQELFNAVIEKVDCTVLEGHRTKARQDMLYRTGKSQVTYPHSRHNSFPSEAADVVPYPIDWDDIERFEDFMEIVKETAEELDIEIECGGEWNTFKDYPHYQLKR